jgi:hypothetical protein
MTRFLFSYHLPSYGFRDNEVKVIFFAVSSSFRTIFLPSDVEIIF